MKGIGAVPLVEIAYDLEASPRDWLQRGAERRRGLIPGAHSAWGGRMYLGEDHPQIIEAWIEGVSDPIGVFRQIHQGMPAAYAASFFRPGTLHGDLSTNLERVDATAEMRDNVFEWLEQLGMSPHQSAVGGFDAYGHGVAVGVSLPGAESVGRLTPVQQRVGVHFNTARRLRESLDGAEIFERAEAVFEVDGRVAHLEGDAGQAREALTETVRRIDHARSRAQRDREDSLELWKGLAQGRWSLIDRIDTDGRRFYVAVANPAADIPARSLNDLERQIVAMAIAGEPNKGIGYALGFAASTVAGKLSEAMRKLGVPNRIDLIRVGKRLLAGEEAGVPIS